MKEQSIVPPQQDINWQLELLTEIRDIRKEFQQFRGDILERMGEQKGRHAVLSAVVSLLAAGSFHLIETVLKSNK